MTFQKDAEKSERKALHRLVNFKNQRVLEVGCGDRDRSGSGRHPRSALRYAVRTAQNDSLGLRQFTEAALPT
jgi:hypothetical protein